MENVHYNMSVIRTNVFNLSYPLKLNTVHISVTLDQLKLKDHVHTCFQYHTCLWNRLLSRG